MITKNNVMYLGGTALAGLAAGIIRWVMMHTGIDERGLLESGSWCATALWVLSVGYLAVMAYSLRCLGAEGNFRQNFPPCKLRTGLSFAGGGLLIAASVGQLPTGQILIGIVGIAAGVCMIFAGYSRYKGIAPSPVFHIIVCIFFLLRLIFSFQRWSADPQLQDYAMQMMALVSLMLFAFHRASCDEGSIDRKRTVFFGLAAAYFCLSALSDETMPLLYLACGLWTVGAGCNLDKLEKEQ
jgi:hypothetical protein